MNPSSSPNQSKKLAAVKAVSFDLDDTFWDCEPVIVKAEDTLYSWLCERYPDVTEKHTRESMPQMRAEMYQTHPHLSTDVSMMRKAFLQQLLNDYDDNEQRAEEAFSVFYRARSEVVLYKGTHELLTALKPDFKLAAITNGNADLNMIGLADYFEDIQCATLTNPPKPAPDMFNSCCVNLGISNAQLLHVGDNPQTDVIGGFLAGVLTVWFNQTGEPWPDALLTQQLSEQGFKGPDFEVSSLPDLQKILT